MQNNMTDDQKMKQALIILGFDEDAINDQLAKLNELIIYNVAMRIKSEKALEIPSGSTEQQIKDLMLGKYSEEEVRQIFQEVRKKIVQEFLGVILEGCSEETITKIEQLI